MDAGKLGDQKLEEFTNDAYRNLTAVSKTWNSFFFPIAGITSDHHFESLICAQCSEIHKKVPFGTFPGLRLKFSAKQEPQRPRGLSPP